jgi:adenylate cyclase
MGTEIERKFLVVGDAWRTHARAPQRLRQGYIGRGPDSIVRVRTMGARAFLTIKSAGAALVRAEYEYEIPTKDAEELLANACAGQLIEKTRHLIEWDGLDWVIDEFEGPLKGLLLAEIELYYADQDIDLPAWAGREVTGVPGYSNEQLSLADQPPVA